MTKLTYLVKEVKWSQAADILLGCARAQNDDAVGELLGLLNGYSYANGNPVNFTDPSGMLAQPTQWPNLSPSIVEPSRTFGILSAIGSVSGSLDLAKLLSSGICDDRLFKPAAHVDPLCCPDWLPEFLRGFFKCVACEQTSTDPSSGVPPAIGIVPGNIPIDGWGGLYFEPVRPCPASQGAFLRFQVRYGPYQVVWVSSPIAGGVGEDRDHWQREVECPTQWCTVMSWFPATPGQLGDDQNIVAVEVLATYARFIEFRCGANDLMPGNN